MSQLSAHTANLDADPRVSLLLAESGKGDPLAHPRLTVSGTAVRSAAEDRARLTTRFLARHPKAALYADFADFSFWRMRVDRAPPQRRLRQGRDLHGRRAAARSCGCREPARRRSRAPSTHMNTDHPERARALRRCGSAGEAGGPLARHRPRPRGARSRRRRPDGAAGLSRPDHGLRRRCGRFWRTSPGRRAVRDRKGAGASAAFPETGQRAVKRSR